MQTVAVGDDLRARLEAERRQLAELEAQVEARDRPLREEQLRLTAQLAQIETDHRKVEATKREVEEAVKALDEAYAQLSGGLHPWQKTVARLVEPAVVATALFVALAAWGLARLREVAIAEGLGLMVGVALSWLVKRRG